MLDSEEQPQTADLSADLENWMSKLPDKLKTKPIIQLALPGKRTFRILCFYNVLSIITITLAYVRVLI